MGRCRTGKNMISSSNSKQSLAVQRTGYHSAYTTVVGMAEHGRTRHTIDHFLGPPVYQRALPSISSREHGAELIKIGEKARRVRRRRQSCRLTTMTQVKGKNK
jgi:hypothetical protein